MVDRLVCLSGQRQQDGFGSVLKKCCSVLSLALLDPVAVDLECARVNELANGLYSIRVTLNHVLCDGLGTAVVAVDSHCGENSHANDLKEKVKGKFTGAH